MARWITLFALIFVASSLLSADEPETPKEKPTISVAFAVPLHHGHRSLNDSGHFHVLVTNISDRPIRLWTDRYSWGYGNLSFEWTDDEGKVTKIKKKAIGWDKNFPDWLEIAPGESYVLNVEFSGEAGKRIWDNLPIPEGKKPRLVKLRAVYAIKPDDESAKHGVWTGRVESAEGTYSIW